MQTLKESLEERQITSTDQEEEYAILLKHALETKSSM